ncbi:AraC family transcriptional regulator [Weissella coleopterorum]|uniref:AraC family transcriptional regulator n=2 Tax=Weissella coleopterorum TaxID=2714949 RepID=A0A6G8B1R4_9LACO|nr:AraC family transcriptional regulator [Weissella coleopterorum]
MNIYCSAIKKYKNKMVIPIHKHKFHQILFVKSGLHEFMIDGTTYHANKNTLLGIPKNCEHTYTCLEKGNILDFKLNIASSDTVMFNTFFMEKINDGLDLTLLNQIYENLLNNRYHADQEIIFIKSIDLLLTLIKQKNTNIPVLPLDIEVNNDISTNIINYFETHFLDNPSMSEIAQHFNISVHEIDKIFLQDFGLSPKSLLQNIRLEYAREQLHQATSISYIANSIDMTLSHFSRTFKAKYGLSPKQYQQNYLANRNIQITFNTEFDISSEPKVVKK